MADIYDRLLAIGAPRVEEPLFFRITLNTATHSLDVELRKRTPNYGMPSVILGRGCTAPFPEEPDRAVINAMREAITRADTSEDMAALVGDLSRYPETK